MFAFILLKLYYTTIAAPIPRTSEGEIRLRTCHFTNNKQLFKGDTAFETYPLATMSVHTNAFPLIQMVALALGGTRNVLQSCHCFDFAIGKQNLEQMTAH